MKKCVNHNCIGRAYEQNAKDLEDESNSACGTKGSCVFDDKEEAVPCGFAEVLRSQSYLNICVFCQEFDEAFKAVEAAAGGTEQGFYNLVFFVSFLNLSFIVFKDNADKLNESNQECTHCK